MMEIRKILPAAAALFFIGTVSSAWGQFAPLLPAELKARNSIALFSAGRAAHRDAYLGRWFIDASGFSEEDEQPGGLPIYINCPDGPCPAQRREAVLFRLARYLRAIPAFLQNVPMDGLVWTELPSGRRKSGEKDGYTVELRVPEGEDVDDILCHELAHIYMAGGSDIPGKFLALRHDTPGFQDGLKKFWSHVRSLNPGRTKGPYILDLAARRMIVENRYPRRHANDVHPVTKPGEYWAASVELAYLAAKTGQWGRLDAMFSASEIEFLKILLKARPKTG